MGFQDKEKIKDIYIYSKYFSVVNLGGESTYNFMISELYKTQQDWFSLV